MTRLLEWLIDLEDIRLGKDAPLSVDWNLPVPAWLLLGLLLLVAGTVWLVYRREKASAPAKFVLILLRTALVALLVAVLCRPNLVLQRNRVEPAHVALLVDRSLSMSLHDRYDDATESMLAAALHLDDPNQANQLSRLEVAAAALTQDEDHPLRTLLLNNAVKLVTFGTEAETAAFVSKGQPAEPLADALRKVGADSAGTNLTGALDLVLHHAEGRRLAAIVLASDGRTTSPGRLDDLLREAADRQVPVYPLRLGSIHKPLDLEIQSVRAQSVVFANDVLLVEAAVAADGLESPTDCTVQLVDDETGEVMEEKKIVLEEPDRPVRFDLSARPAREGPARFRVRVVPNPAEEVLENNQDVVDVRVLADRLKVLYVEEYPRFEYRYLKNALLREKSIELSVLLLEADPNFIQEGAEVLRRFPETRQDLSRFHVVLFGDVDPQEGWLTPMQMNLLLEFVGQQGGGFGLLGGERNAPRRFAGTPLERLIPVTIDPQPAGQEQVRLRGFQPQITHAGRESRLLRFFTDSEENAQAILSFPPLYWAGRTLGVKPGAMALLEDLGQSTAGGPLPLVVLGRYGAGKIFFQATDDTWRWRRHTGELLYDGYWVRVVRELMNSSFSAGDRRYIIRTDRRAYDYGEPVRVQMEVLDPRLVAADQERMALRVTPLGGGLAPATGGAPLETTIDAQRLGADSHLFEVNYVPGIPGSFIVSAPELAIAGGGRASSAVFRVEKPDLELRRRDADHQALARIAAVTGGKVLEPTDLASQLGEIRDRGLHIPDDIVEPLWDSRLVFTLFILMISLEWVLRKAFGLL